MFTELLFGSSTAHIIFILAVTIALGTLLGKVKIGGITLGVTWILFVGIALGHFKMGIDPKVLGFVKEFGLILFIYSVGMQVGPGFFSSLKQNGLKLNMLSLGVILAGILVTCLVAALSGTSLITMTGVMSGAVTNTPALGSAQQTYLDTMGSNEPSIALGYAVAYPLGVIGLILSLILLRRIFRVDPVKEDERLHKEHVIETHDPDRTTVVITNPQVDGRRVHELARLMNRPFVISRVLKEGGEPIVADAQTVVGLNDKVFFVSDSRDTEAVVAFLGRQIDMPQEEWDRQSRNTELVSRRILVTRSSINGKQLGSLQLRNNYKVNVTRVNRSGVDLIASPSLELLLGDRLTVVGSENSIQEVSGLLGNSSKRLLEPNIIPMFVGILLGVVVGMIPFHISGIPLPVKLGLAGGPLIVAILLSRFGARFHLVTYTTISASLMLREIGISLFLAAVGLSAGPEFISTLQGGGYVWVGYGFLITVIPILIMGIVGRWVFKLNYFALMGTLAGSMTNPIALSFVTSNSPNDIPAVSYSTVYPLTMFLRVVSAQILVLAAL
ncbi:MAG: putative transporter [Bacteroidales bacterium]|nr:putative transporter [Bacteroidales bacterium]MBR0500337.1 putative transporter [Bacteroidales bacterium]